MEQVKRWNNGRVRIEGAVSGEADTRKAGDKEGGSSGAGSRARSQVKSGGTHLFPPPPPGPEGPSHPQPTGGGAHADAPFSVFCRLGSASSCGRRVGVAAKWERDLPLSRPCSSPPARAPQGSRSKSKGLPASAASLTAPQAPQPSPNLLFSSSLQRGPFVVIIFFFLI